jgi:SAM-dependent methyltransferase
MLREVGHFFRHVPAIVALKRGRSRVEFFELISERFDRAGMYDKRRQLVGELQGRMLEIGCGTGRMFPHYSRGAHVTAIEPNPEFEPHAADVARRAAATIAVVAGSGEQLPFPNGSFDAAVFSMVLCSVPSVEAVLSEVKRVLKPGAQMHLIEHGRSDRAFLAFLMDVFNPLWRLANGSGCNMNRDPVASLRAAGFAVRHSDPFQIVCPGLPAFPTRIIHARC